MTGRLTALTLIVSLSGSSAALAGESLVQSGSRIIEKAVQGPAQPGESLAATISTAAIALPPFTLVSRINRPLGSASLTQEGRALAESGMSRRKKVLIFIAAGAGFAASAWVIDHNVLDITPSSLGQRKD
jgi:hypothetical protein